MAISWPTPPSGESTGGKIGNLLYADTTNTRVGINTTTPNTVLDVNGLVKIGDFTTCDANTEGTIRYNSTSQKIEFCDGSDWGEVGAAGVTDPEWNNVVLLMNMEDATDVKGHTTTPNGVSFVAGKFNNAGSFDNSTSYIDLNHSDFDMSTSDFTAELWFKLPANSDWEPLLNSSDSNGNNRSWYMDITNDGVIRVYVDADGTATTYDYADTTTAIDDNAWHHVALVRNGSDYVCYVDGVAELTISGFGNIYAHNKISIGASSGDHTHVFSGLIDEVRITKGVARYTTNFTPPTEAFPTQ